MPRGWLLLLCLLLLLWEPLSLALLASTKITGLIDRPAALLILAARIGVAGLGIASGLMLWAGRSAGPLFGKAYLMASSAVVVLALGTRSFPSNVMPGLALPLAAVLLAQNAAWFGYLTRSTQVSERSR
jgi:hypothetical protein